MNDEIREILARLSKYVITPDVRHDFDDLLDYITNLQEENQQLRENNQAMQEEMARTWQKYDDYKSRCEKALKDIDLLLSGTYSKQSGEAVTVYMKSDCCNLRLEIIKHDLQNGRNKEEKQCLK